MRTLTLYCSVERWFFPSCFLVLVQHMCHHDDGSGRCPSSVWLLWARTSWVIYSLKSCTSLRYEMYCNALAVGHWACMKWTSKFKIQKKHKTIMKRACYEMLFLCMCNWFDVPGCISPQTTSWSDGIPCWLWYPMALNGKFEQGASRLLHIARKSPRCEIT